MPSKCKTDQSNDTGKEKESKSMEGDFTCDEYYNTMSDISKCGWTENEDDDAGFTEHYKAAEEYLLKYLPSSESKFTQTEFREKKSMEKRPRQKDGKVYRDCLDVSPEKVLRNLNKLNSVQLDNNEKLEHTQNIHRSFNSRSKSLKFNNGLGFKRKRETQGGSLNTKGQHNKCYPRLKEKICFKFRDTGRCKYGYHCKFSHNIERKEQTDNNSHLKQVQDTNVKLF